MKKIFTGALAFILFATAAQAQVRGDSTRQHHRGMAPMGKELNLTAEQKQKMKSIMEAEKKEMDALKAQSSVTREQQQQQRQAIHQKYAEQRQALLTPAQREQVEKIKAERPQGDRKGREGMKGRKPGMKGEGFEKGRRMEEELNLTQDQKDRLAKSREAARAQMASIHSDKSLTQEQKREKMETLRKQQHEEMQKILTKEQLEKMKEHRKDRGAKNTK